MRQLCLILQGGLVGYLMVAANISGWHMLPLLVANSLLVCEMPPRRSP